MNIWGVFQSLHNPYESNNLVLATRKNYTQFLNALQKKSNDLYWSSDHISKDGAITISK